MKKQTLILSIVVLVALSAVAAIKFFTDYPNAFPVDTDVFVYQRANTYGNASGLQMRTYFTQNVQVTNTYISTITNNTIINTNTIVATSNAFFNNTYITNFTVAFPGGITNLNATPHTLAYWDINQQLASLPNSSSGVLTNDGAGGIGWSTVLQLAALYIQNGYFTNSYFFITNAPILATDGNGQAVASSYKYSTNIVGAGAWTFGKAFWTNITADFTSPALTMQDSAAMETMAIFITNSAAATHTITIPGVAGAPGHVVPAVFYATNATVTEIDITHFGIMWTNAKVGAN